MPDDKFKVGMIGCGKISNRYLPQCNGFDILDVVACADMVPERAREQAAEYGIPRACSVEELLADPDIDIAVDLTIPQAHAEVNLAVLEAGKHLHSEKPLALTREEGRKTLAKAEEKGLRVAAAPDTFMGGGQQTCRKLIDEGAIGEPVAASAFLVNHGAEHWHPNPDFLFQPGAGPMFDVGVYYLTALVNLMGPVKRVSAMSRITFPERTITSQPRYGEKIQVNTPTHITGVMEFASGALTTMITSSDVWASDLPRIEVYGSEGTLSCPDPNTFGGEVKIRKGRAEEWETLPLTHGYTEQFRGIAVADLAHGLRSGRAHRVTGELAYHVLDVMLAFLDASEQGRTLDIESTCERPAPLPMGLAEGTLDD